MSGEWQFVVNQAAWEAMAAMRSIERRQFRRGLEMLLADPHQQADAEMRSSRDRTYSVKYIGRFRVLYWLDAYVKELRVVKIERVPFR